MRRGAGNQPQWRGKPGFFEIWFLVVFVPGECRAIWLRYTLFAPAAGQPGRPRATLWAAAFDARADETKLALKSIQPIDMFVARGGGTFGIRIADAEFSNGVCRGRIEEQGRSIAWDLTFEPSADHDERHSMLLSPHLPMPTRAIHSHENARFRGTYSIDGRTFVIDDAPGLQKHIWGYKRVEELLWLYCPQFLEDRSARLEVTSVRAMSKLVGPVPFPDLASAWFLSVSETYEFYSAWHLFHNRLESPHPGKLHLTARSSLQSIEVSADCDMTTLVGYVYRDPGGQDLYVAQSDIANCEVRLYERPHLWASFRHTKTLTSTNGAAIEFHLPQPLPGVRYIGWNETGLEPLR